MKRITVTFPEQLFSQLQANARVFTKLCQHNIMGSFHVFSIDEFFPLIDFYISILNHKSTSQFACPSRIPQFSRGISKERLAKQLIRLGLRIAVQGSDPALKRGHTD